MFGITDIIKKIIDKKPLTEEEKFKMMNARGVDPEVVTYLANRFKNLEINKPNIETKNILELMDSQSLSSDAFSACEAAVVFLNMDDYIERGYLYLEYSVEDVFHSWICFSFKGEKYVLDPAFNFVCKESTYKKLLLPDVQAKIMQAEVKEEFIKENMGSSAPFKKVNTPQTKYDPLYRNFTSFQLDVEEETIRSLILYYN